MKWQKELDLAIRAARETGRRLQELAQGEIDVISSIGRDIKLKADQEAERIILGHLQRDSRWPVLAEESGEHGTPETGPFWVIDPLDGTLNFSRGLPICCISIALVEGVQPIFGVIMDFNRDELFSGVTGEGAWLNGREITVSNVTDTSQAILATGLPVGRDFSTEALAGMIDHFQRFKKTRMIGSAALSLAYVACGRVDAYTEDDIMLWDVAAGLAIILGAGGYVALEPSSHHKWAYHVHVAANQAIWHQESNP